MLREVKIGEGDIKMRKLVEEVLMNDQKIGEVEKSVKCGQEECKKHEKTVMIAGVSDEDKFVKCLDDITGRELPWQAVKQAREKELKYLRELGVYEMQSTMSFRSTQSGSILKRLRWSRFNSVHESLPESSKVETGQTSMREVLRWKP